MKLQPPFDTFKIEKHAGEYKDFGASEDYPLKGVTYPVDYGDIQGYVAEDGANLDLFVVIVITLQTLAISKFSAQNSKKVSTKSTYI